jgi:SAM-dependent methyltransferase
MKNDAIRDAVRSRYGEIARRSGSCCGPSGGCCGDAAVDQAGSAASYTAEDLAGIPEGSDLGLGCGNPLALASIREGDTVLDLGSGAGIDCFLAAARVGENGRVIGVDMTHDMLARARENASRSGIDNVDFRLGEIENLPVADASVDLAISNCVINLSVDKLRVFQEVFRVLRPEGRLMVSDIVLLGELPKKVRESSGLYAACVAGALAKDLYLSCIEKAGFEKIELEKEASYSGALTEPSVMKSVEREWGLSESELKSAASLVQSITVSAVKPR